MQELLSNVIIVDNVIQHKNIEFINIHIDEKVLNKLSLCKIYSNESHSDVIDRLLDEKLKNNK